MGDLPGVNSLLYVSVTDELSYRSRVEDIDGSVLTIAAPMGRGDLDIPDVDAQFCVFWLSTRARYVLPVRMLGQTRERPPRWHVRAVDEPRVQTRRNFVRGGGGGPAQIITVHRGVQKRTHDGLVVDVSEGGVRCRLPKESDIDPGEQVMVRMDLDGHGLEITGNVLSLRPSDPESIDVVVTYQPPESDAKIIRRYVFQWEIAERRRRLNEDDLAAARR